MPHSVTWSATATEQLMEHRDWLAQQIGFDAAAAYCDQFIDDTVPLADYPYLYQVRAEYGAGVRCIPRRDGGSILYEVDEEAKSVQVLALAGSGQLARPVR